MINLSRWKVGLVILATFIGILFSLPNFLPPSVRDQVSGFLPTKVLNLGLDLQGGSYLLVEVDTDALHKERTGNLVEQVRNELNQKQIQFTGLTGENNRVQVHITNADQYQEAYSTLSRMASPIPNNASAMDMVATREPNQTLRLAFTEEGIRATSARAVDTSIEIVRRRIDSLGTKEPSIARQGLNRITVEAPGESDPEQLKRIIGTTAKLTFQMVDESASPQDLAAGRAPPGAMILMDESQGGVPLAVRRQILVSGNNLTSARVGVDQSNRPAIDFSFDGEGSRKFGEATRQNVGRRFAIILDGKIVSAPNIISPITGGNGQITGSFTPQEASELVNVLNGGALPAPLKFESQRTVGAELGKDAIDKGVVSTIIAFITIVAFMFLAYGFVFGGVSIAALLVNLLLIISAMTVFGATLTLPGVAGLILSLAVAVDANVLIYERIRDEERAGHKPLAAMDVGFSRALVSILDANITSLIAALIMLQFGAGPVRGFAWTLMIGVFTSVFSAIFVSQVLLGWWYRTFKPQKLPI